MSSLQIHSPSKAKLFHGNWRPCHDLLSVGIILTTYDVQIALLISDTERKLNHPLPSRVVQESEKNGLSTARREKLWTQIGYKNIKQLQKFYPVSFFLTQEGICDTEVQSTQWTNKTIPTPMQGPEKRKNLNGLHYNDEISVMSD